MATLTIQPLTLSDSTATLAAADVAGDEVENDNGLILLVLNGDVSSTDVTLTSQVTSAPGITAADHTVSVPAGDVAAIPVEGNGRFTDASGLVQITYTSVTSLEVAAVSF